MGEAHCSTLKELPYNNGMNDSSNLTSDAIAFWNDHVLPIITWCTDRWMDCYELSAGWTVGITIVVALYILSKFSSDDTSNSESVSTPTKETVRLKSYAADVRYTNSGGKHPGFGLVWARNRMEAESMIYDKHPGFDNGLLVLRSVKYTGSFRDA